MFRILFRAAAKAFKQLADKVVNILLRARTQDSLNNRLTITFLLWRLVRLDGDFMVAKLLRWTENDIAHTVAYLTAQMWHFGHPSGRRWRRGHP
jgi:hypothetical protein